MSTASGNENDHSPLKSDMFYTYIHVVKALVFI